MQDTTSSESRDPDKTRSDVTALGSRSGTDSDKMEMDDQSHDVLEWLQNFTENLKNPETFLPAHISQEGSDSERSTKVVEKSKLRRHCIETHFPEDRNCDVWLRSKITRCPCSRRTGEGSIPRAEKFSDLITADHKVLNWECESRNSHRYACVAQDLVNQWIQAHPCRTKTSQEFTDVSPTVTKAKSR